MLWQVIVQAENLLDRIAAWFFIKKLTMGDVRQELRMLLMVLSLAVFVVVFVVMLVSMWRQHRSDASETPNFHASIAVELSWALTPCVIVFLMIYPTVKAIFKI